MSAHADVNEIKKWLGTFTKPPATTYLGHGEAVPQQVLKQHIESTFGWRVHIPGHGETVEVPL
jgi:metallo-beta-lactamase family protein